MSTPQFDADSPYATLNYHETNGYLRATVRDHPVADGRGRVRLHRAVLFDAIGDGPHECHWCGIGGLRWDTDQSDPDYLTVDHVDHNRVNNQLENLAPTHKWCNDNRSIIESLGIPWSAFAGLPMTELPPLRTREGKPTEAALALAAVPALEAAAEPFDADEETGEAATFPAPSSHATGVHRLYVWDDFADLGAFAKGRVVLKPPPEWLLAKHPQLRKVDFSRFGS